MAKVKTSKKDDHVLHEVLPCKINKRQPSLQWGDGERGRCGISCVLHFVLAVRVKFEVLEIREKPDEIQDLTARAFGILESEKSKRRREVSEALLNGRHEAGHVKVVYSQLLEVRKSGEVTQDMLVEPHDGERFRPAFAQTDPELFDEWE